MLFKPSYKIESIEVNSSNTIVHLEDAFLGSLNNYIYLIAKSDYSILSAPVFGQITQKSQDNKRLVVNLLGFSSIDTEEEYISLVDLGSSDSIYIGINSGPNQNAHLYGEGLTVSRFNYDNNVESYNLRTFLGNLGKLGISGVSGYGLYGDNVYLNGSVTTYNSVANKYSGINTLSNVAANKFTNIDTSPIVFWGGADSNATADIQNAPFQVTQNGSLYATNGLFSGIVQGSDIRVGQGLGLNGSIKVYDSNDNVIGQIDSNGFKLSFGGSMKDVPAAVANAETTALDVKARADSGEFDGTDGVDGVDGESAFYVVIDSSAGNIFRNQGINTTLTARAYYGSTEVTEDVTQWLWEKHFEDGTMDPTWSRLSTNVITLSPSDVEGHAIFYVYATYNSEGV